jgi:hypothetical protein
MSTNSWHILDFMYSIFSFPCIKLRLISPVAYLPHARAAEAQKPRNTQTTIEVRVFIPRCWVSHATVEWAAAPRPATLVATQRSGEHISAAVSRHATMAAVWDVFCAVGAHQQYNWVCVRSAPRTLNIFAAGKSSVEPVQLSKWVRREYAGISN